MFLKTLCFAVKSLCRKPHALKKIGVFILVIVILFGTVQLSAQFMAEKAILSLCIRWLWIPFSVLFLIIRHGEILKRHGLKRFFIDIGLYGYDGNIPEYIRTDIFGRYLTRFRFMSRVHICEWEKIISKMEMYFKRKIYDYKNLEEDITIMDIYTKERGLPTCIEWNDDFMVDGRRFTIGEGYKGREIWDATVFNHGIVAGSTSSGKTSLLRCIIHQAVQKKYNISVFDFKGGGDFVWLEKGYGSMIVSEPKEARDLLITLVVEVRGRMDMFKKADVTNIDEYNARGRDRLVPWLIVLDETAEILDVKPKDKAEKELYAEIDQSLRTLARISRAAGVNILFGIIRPSSEVLDGQIKNNALWRACGYFKESAASRIVLENDKATELSPDIKGRFIIGDEEVQVYYLPIPHLPEKTDE